MKRMFILIVALCLIAVSADARQKKSSPKSGEVRLVKDKPSVYITFEKQGNREPLKPGEGTGGIWLRFHNNTKWPVFFRAFSVPTELGEVGMYYEIEALPRGPVAKGSQSSAGIQEDIKRKSDLPTGYQPTDGFSVISIEPGESILFSVPSEHLAEGLCLRISFNYGWEDQNDVTAGREAVHQIYFCSSDLPQRQKKQ